LSTYYAEAAAAVAANHKLNARDLWEISRFALCTIAFMMTAVAMV